MKMPATILAYPRLNGSLIAQGLTVICRVLLSISTLPAFSAEITVDPEKFAANQTFARDSLSPDWFNGPNHILQRDSWTTNKMNYLVADDSKNFILKSRASARDMEVDTWTRNGYVYLRMSEDGTAIFFRFIHDVDRGWLHVGIITGVGEDLYEQGSIRYLYSNEDLLGTLAGYRKSPTDTDYFTFGVEGFDVYAKLNGKEFLRFKEYRHMKEGRAALKASPDGSYPNGHGFRKTSLRFRETPKPLFSDYQNLMLDMRDFGLRSLQTVGSIAGGSNQLRLQSAPNPSFQKGDYLIVELGGEAGRGLRGTMGVGGTWPAKRYPDAATRNADRSQPLKTFAWTESDGSVRRWDGTTWYDDATSVNTSITPPTTNYFYYLGKAVPLALRASITEISQDGTLLTLSTNANASSTNASVYLDNAFFIDKLVRNSTYDGENNYPKVKNDGRNWDLTSITPRNVTLFIPPGNYAFGELILIEDHPGWQLVGGGADQTRLFSPKGTPSMSIRTSNSPDLVVRDLHLHGNARNQGFGLTLPTLFTFLYIGINETGYSLGEGGSILPSGLVFGSRSDRGHAKNLKLTDVFSPAAGASFSDDVWVENCHLTLTEGQRAYIQWSFLWSDSRGGGCTNSSLWSSELVHGFESAKSTGTQFLNCTSTNGIFSNNSAGNFLYRNIRIVVLPGSQPVDRSFSEYESMFNVGNNFGYTNYLAQGGRIENVQMIQTGYINSDHDTLKGVSINENNPNVTVVGGSYSSPDYTPPTKLWGALGLDSTGLNTVVDGFRVVGAVDGRQFDGYANINLYDGVVRNSVADRIRITGPGQIENCRPNSNQAPIIGTVQTGVVLKGGDIGVADDPLIRGSTTTNSDGMIEVVAGGSSTSPTWLADRTHYFQLPIVGDFDLSVQLSRLDRISSGSQAGLMIRRSLDPESRSIRLVQLPAGNTRDGGFGPNRHHLMVRSTDFSQLDGYYAHQGSGNPQSDTLPNAWFRLTRRGDTFTAYRGSHGFFQDVFSRIIAPGSYPEQIFAGLVTTSANNHPGMATVADYRNFRLINLSPINLKTAVEKRRSAVAAAENS